MNGSKIKLQLIHFNCTKYKNIFILFTSAILGQSPQQFARLPADHVQDAIAAWENCFSLSFASKLPQNRKLVQHNVDGHGRAVTAGGRLSVCAKLKNEFKKFKNKNSKKNLKNSKLNFKKIKILKIKITVNIKK